MLVFLNMYRNKLLTGDMFLVMNIPVTHLYRCGGNNNNNIFGLQLSQVLTQLIPSFFYVKVFRISYSVNIKTTSLFSALHQG